MGQLTNLYVSESYQGLLKMTDSTNGLTSTLQTVQTGDGDNSPLQMSLTQVNISGSLTVNGSPITGSAVDTGSFATTGSNQFNGSQSISGSVTLSGSVNNVNYIDFNTGSAVPAWKSGRVFWDNTDSCLGVYNAEQDITLQVGQEMWVRARNNTGVAIQNGAAVRLIGALGDNPLIVLAQSVQVSGSINTDNQILGLATHTIETGTDGYVTTLGNVRGLNTNAYNEGDVLFVSSSAGQLTKVVPLAPYERIPVATVVKKGPGASGIVYVAPQSPIDFPTLSSVEISGSYQNGDMWQYEGNVWKHKTINQIGLATTGSNTFIGNQSFSGSVNITGSLLVNGTSFSSGTSGTSGINGSSGTSGQNGSSGTSGTSGLAGSSGTSGTSGTSGVSPSLDGVITTGSIGGSQSITGSLNISTDLTVQGNVLTDRISNESSTILTVEPNTQLILGNSATTSSLYGQLELNNSRIILNTGTVTGATYGWDINNGGQDFILRNANVTITGSANISGSLNVKGDTTLSGSLIGNTVNNGQINIFSEAFNSGSVKLNISASAPISQSNVIFGNTTGPAAVTQTGSVVMSGSNNIILIGTRANTLVTAGTYGYINGFGNIGTVYPTLGTGSILRPATNNNALQSSLNLQFTTSSIVGTPTFGNNLIYGPTNINHQSGSGNFTFNYIGGNGFTSNANTTTLSAAATNFGNIIAGVTSPIVTLNHNSSSILYQGNIGGGMTVNNNYSSSVSTAVNNITVTGNILGGQSNTLVVSGSNTGTRRTFDSNVVIGRSNIINSNFSGGTGGHLVSTALLGQDLIVSASSVAPTQGGTVYVGRFNATGSLQEDANQAIFVVGNGTGAGARSNAIHIESSGNNRMTGSLKVSGSNHQIVGNTVITGSINTSSSTFVILSGSMRLSNESGSVRIADNNNQAQLFFNPTRKVGFFLGQSNMDQTDTQFGITSDSTDNYVMGGNFNSFRSGSNNLMLGIGTISIKSGSNNIILAKATSYTTGSNNLILGSLQGIDEVQDYFNVQLPQSNQPIMYKSGSAPLTISGSINVSGSANITNVMNLTPQNPLPAGTVGDLAVSSSNQLYFYNGAWTLIV